MDEHGGSGTGGLVATGGLTATGGELPHDVDVKALLRIAVLYNIPIACNRSTADFLISSPLMDQKYKPSLVDYTAYIQRNVDTDKGGRAHG